MKTRPNMGNSYAPLANSPSSGTPKTVNTITNLRRWSCSDNDQLPPTTQIKTIHVYDFDNTLFASPLPNRQVWDGASLGQLMAEDKFANGGWWHDPTFLSATGEGVEREEPRAWSGWWNEQVANLCELSMQQKDALSILLTGRGENKFADLIKRMVKSRGLAFHMICLKPQVTPNNRRVVDTMSFKQELLRDVIFTYNEAEEIRIYEDRPPHVGEFRRWLQELNENLASNPNARRKPIQFEVVEVAMEATNLDPVKEVSEVQRIINEHNLLYKAGKLDRRAQPLQIKSVVFNTGYLLKAADTKKLIEEFIPPEVRSMRGIKIHADAIPIAMASAPNHILNAVGGIGNKVRFNITAQGQLEDRLWAVRVEPTNPREKIHTLNHPPSIVLALKDARTKDVNSIQKWTAIPPHQCLQIETMVGEKTMLSIVPEIPTPQHRQKRPRDDHREHDIGVGNVSSQTNVRGGGLSSSYRGGNQGRGRGRDRSDRGRGNKPGRGNGRAGRGGSYRSGAAGYTDYDAGGGRRDQAGSDFFNAY
ncbi:uncharacterized protein PV09_08554 [Verruconis gallopava]|uniref:Swiss Army Knife RNA repair protein HAD domain-containing protein n=1 Tax=Verruconis gallopava TaxID=253628 RepID=A0A0D1YGG4_9PEZI|nr:uncharacterized protein PV09_08554 [Verruconis gallopava]KIV99891.1 hypothetical protein PV09_08554 [Verruconis gallopava]